MSSGDRKMNKTKKTALNFTTSVINLFLNGIFTIIVVRRVLDVFGSDYNGLNATVTQVILVFTLVDGSFTLASLVALYKPYSMQDFSLFNRIISTTKSALLRIGAITIVSGIVFSLIYPFFVNTSLDYGTILIILLISLITVSFNTLFVNKYRVIYQVTQSEYIINLFQSLNIILSQIGALLVITYTRNLVLLRLQYALFTVLTGLLVIYMAKRRFKFIDFHQETDFSLIKGTKDVMVTATTGMIYRSAPTFFISAFSGTMYTSVYSVYNYAITIIHNVIYGFLESPKNALGQILSSGRQDHINRVFDEYERTTILLINIFFTTTYVMLIPFIRIYTRGISDVRYEDPFIASFLVLNAVLMLIHIPSGIAINLAGHFKAVRRIQVTALISLMFTMVIFGYFFGLRGIIFSNTCTSLILALQEITYTRKNILKTKLSVFYRFLGPNLILGFLISLGLEPFIQAQVSSWLMFLIWGFVVFTVTATLIIVMNSVLFPKTTSAIRSRIMSIVKRR